MKTTKRIRLLLMTALMCALISISAHAAVSISTKSLTLQVGSTYRLLMKGTSSSSSVTWKSSKKKVASVTSTGIVKGVSAGTATVSARVGSKTYKCKVTVLSKVKISASTLTVRVGSSYKLKLTGLAKGQKVKWSSSKKAVASVSSKGVVKGKKTGKTVITAKVGSKKYTCKVTVKKKQTTTIVVNTTKSVTTTSTVTTTTTVLEEEPAAAVTGTAVAVKTASAAETSTSSMSSEEAAVYKILISFKNKAKYKEGAPYTNDDYYAWNGGTYRGGYGCAAFTFELSDAAFGDTIATVHTNWDKIKVGDILRVDDDCHSVIVLKVNSSYVTVAEGNYNESCHWGREIPISELKSTGTYIMTRYESTTSVSASGMRRMRASLPILYDMKHYPMSGRR